MKPNTLIPIKNSVLLAPLAGVSDFPFRLVCQKGGADLTYVEMLSSLALIYKNRKTLKMLKRHPEEKYLGVQVTGRNTEELKQAVSILNDYPFDTIDINMGCPVKKVVNSGSGSAILKDVDRVYESVRQAVAVCSVPVSVKIRLGWDRDSLNYLEVADAAAQAGASWLTVHGRTRSERYISPVDLDAIGKIKQKLHIPVFGNGNIFSQKDAEHMQTKTLVDGVMVSRGALGNPWIFSEIKNQHRKTNLVEWMNSVKMHIDWQKEAYPEKRIGVLCMRKHLLWYLKGWPNAHKAKEKVNSVTTFEGLHHIVEEFTELMQTQETSHRFMHHENLSLDRFSWNPSL
jgi:tRNA-dihydrouridine synthase B